MFFTALMGLLSSVDCLVVSLTSNSDGTITVFAQQKGGDITSPLNIGLPLTGTPEELDAEFSTLVAGYTAKRKSLTEQLEETNAILEASTKEASAKAVKALSGKSSNKVAVPPPGGDRDLDDDDEGNDVVPPATAAAPVVAVETDNLFA